MTAYATLDRSERFCEIYGTNHVHLIAVPNSEDVLRRAIGEAHRLLTSAVSDCHPERSEGSPSIRARSFAALRMTVGVPGA